MRYTCNFFKNIFIISIAFFLFYSCDKNRVFEDIKEIPEGTWNRKNKISFEINVTDTTSMNNIYINIRNKGSYIYRNIYMFMNTVYPDNKLSTDTFVCVLANDKGRWLGKGIGDLWFNRMLFKKNLVFPKKGKYIFRFEQAMRDEDLTGITDIGIRIEKVEE
ncbi:MAG: gliding motility lipoprotein GldH [Bacteroidales bacterium]|nr:gliding motility lipoprotein GldH [Bacteroidales bacterium]